MFSMVGKVFNLNDLLEVDILYHGHVLFVRILVAFLERRLLVVASIEWKHRDPAVESTVFPHEFSELVPLFILHGDGTADVIVVVP